MTLPDAPSDAALVRRMAAGDESAVGALYDRYGATLYALAVRILGDREDAEEAVMDAMAQAWSGANRYAAERGSVGAWLVVLVRSRALDRRRAGGRRLLALDRAAAAEAAPGMGGAPPPTSAAAEAGEQRARVLAALAALPEPQRVCLELAYYDGLSQSEIAARLAEPLGTVKTRTRQALIRLRERLLPLRLEQA